MGWKGGGVSICAENIVYLPYLLNNVALYIYNSILCIIISCV